MYRPRARRILPRLLDSPAAHRTDLAPPRPRRVPYPGPNRPRRGTEPISAKLAAPRGPACGPSRGSDPRRQLGCSHDPPRDRASHLRRRGRSRHRGGRGRLRARLLHDHQPDARGAPGGPRPPAAGRSQAAAHARRGRRTHRLQGPPLGARRPLAGHGQLPTAVPDPDHRLRSGAGGPRLGAAVAGPPGLVVVGGGVHRLAVDRRHRPPDRGTAPADPPRRGRPALRRRLRRRHPHPHLPLRRLLGRSSALRRGRRGRRRRLRPGAAHARARPARSLRRPGPVRLDPLPAHRVDRTGAGTAGHHRPGHRHHRGGHDQGRRLDGLVHRRRPPALHGRGLAPLPGLRQPLRTQQHGRHQVARPRQAAALRGARRRPRAVDGRDPGRPRRRHGGRRGEGRGGEPGRGPDPGLHLEGPAGLLHLHRVRTCARRGTRASPCPPSSS